MRTCPHCIWSPSLTGEQAPTWCVGYRDREYARLMDDPVLCYVVAYTKDDAEAVAAMAGFGNPAGLWAWRPQ